MPPVYHYKVFFLVQRLKVATGLVTNGGGMMICLGAIPFS
jgi:hypothetical protein